MRIWTGSDTGGLGGATGREHTTHRGQGHNGTRSRLNGPSVDEAELHAAEAGGREIPKTGVHGDDVLAEDLTRSMPQRQYRVTKPVVGDSQTSGLHALVACSGLRQLTAQTAVTLALHALWGPVGVGAQLCHATFPGLAAVISASRRATVRTVACAGDTPATASSRVLKNAC
jgi:D-aminopeptidase